uniref:Uncharacterized protein n=1 Tax=Triticum urartu TaxID=4572 RepID=A0A8R7PML0_TRIUA
MHEELLTVYMLCLIPLHTNVRNCAHARSNRLHNINKHCNETLIVKDLGRVRLARHRPVMPRTASSSGQSARPVRTARRAAVGSCRAAAHHGRRRR